MNKSHALHSLYKITALQENPEKAIATIVLNEESEIYKAHFPSDPITPGVCELIMIKEVLCTLYPDMHVALSSARQIKFIDVIRPTEVKSFFLELKHQLDEDNILVDARIFKEQTDFLKAKLNYLISA